MVEVNDNKYKRRSSLPSYISFGKHEENVKAEENGSGKNGSLKSMTDIMNEVVKETDETRLSSSPSSKSSHSYSPVNSSLVVRPLMCSPYVSPEKLYPKFVFTPKVSPQTGDSEKASYSLDTTGDSMRTSSCSGSPVSEIGEQSEQELPLKNKEDSENHLQTTITIEDRFTKSEQAMESDKESVSLSVKQQLFTCNSDSISVTKDSSHKVTESAVHTVVMRPTPSTKSPHIVRASSPIADESDRETKYYFVKKETRVHSPTPVATPSPTVSPVPEIDSYNKELKSPTIELLTLKDSSPVIDASPEPAKDIDKNVKNDQYPSEMNLMDSLSSYLSSTFSDDNSLTLKLISPDRTKTLLDEATTHVRRRRPSSAKKTLSSRAISESGLTATSTAQGSPLRLRHHTSTPLISPARHDMLIRQASERILAKRKSTISNEDGHLEQCSGTGIVQPLDLTSVCEDHSLMEVEPSPSESITTHAVAAIDTVTDSSGTKRNGVTRGNIERHNSERSQRRQLSGLFKWRSFRVNTRQNNKDH